LPELLEFPEKVPDPLPPLNSSEYWQTAKGLERPGFQTGCFPPCPEPPEESELIIVRSKCVPKLEGTGDNRENRDNRERSYLCSLCCLLFL
jgi:hypothetical protein